MNRNLRDRFASACIDLFLVAAIGGGISSVAFVVLMVLYPDSHIPWGNLFVAVFHFGLPGGPISAALLEGFGLDIGRRANNLRLVDLAGVPVGSKRRLARSLTKYLLPLGVFYYFLDEFGLTTWAIIVLGLFTANGLLCLYSADNRSILDRIFNTASVSAR